MFIFISIVNVLVFFILSFMDSAGSNCAWWWSVGANPRLTDQSNISDILHTGIDRQGRKVLKAHAQHRPTSGEGFFHGMLQNNRANKSIQITLSPFSPGSPTFPATPWHTDTKQTNDTQQYTLMTCKHFRFNSSFKRYSEVQSSKFTTNKQFHF